MNKQFLVCIDSDGCAFDTMEIKHKVCFCPAYIQHFGLQAVVEEAREAWDFANLYSSTRGINRFLALLRALDRLSANKSVCERVVPPTLPELRQYVAQGGALNNEGLDSYLVQHPESEEIRMILEWSKDVNVRISQKVHGVPPFPNVRESLEALGEHADIVIVSATPQEALEREWEEHGLRSLVAAVKGQESGSKKEIIASLMPNYTSGHVLMIGDALGDRDAARANGALFFPICPGEEPESWAKFDQCMQAFLNGTYAGEAEAKNIERLLELLPQ